MEDERAVERDGDARVAEVVSFASRRARMRWVREVVDARSSETRLRSGKRCVLIIEDNVDMADTLRELLERRNHEVVVAHNGAEGVEMARELHPRVIVCDIGLPGMSGYDVCRTLRSDDAFQKTYLIALTGYAEPDDAERAQAAGFDTHLTKPVNPDVVVQMVTSAGPSLARAHLRMSLHAAKVRRSR